MKNALPYIYGALIGGAIASLVWYAVMQAKAAKENKAITNGGPTPTGTTQTPTSTTVGETPASAETAAARGY